MPNNKSMNIFSETGKFFKENDSTSAIMDMTRVLRQSEKRLFSSKSKCNCKLTRLQVLEGGLFMDDTIGSIELTLAERIWNMVLGLVREIAECFNIEDENILDMLVNCADKLNHFVEIYQ